MKISKFTPSIILSVLILIALSSCGPPKPDKPPKDDNDFEPMLIEKIKSPENITSAMWDETHNTFLVLKIRRIVTYEGPQNQKSVIEVTADLPLFGQREKDEAGVYGEGVGKVTLFGEIPGVGFSEAEWVTEYWVYGWIYGPKCYLELRIDEKWLEGIWCTTVLGITDCETNMGYGFQQLAYGLVEFPYVVGSASKSSLDALNFTAGPTTFQVEIEIVSTGEHEINLPDVKDCLWGELLDDLSD